MEEVQKILREALEKAGKGQKEKVFEEARTKLLKLQEKYYSEKKVSEYNVLYDIKELAKKLGVKYKDYE